MSVKFYVDGFRNLVAEMDGEREMMIAPHFLQNENNSKAAEYLRKIAAQLTKLYSAGQVDKAGALLEEAESKVRDAQTAEKFMEEVTF